MAQQNVQFEGASQDPNLIIPDLPLSNRSTSRQTNNNNKYNKSYNNRNRNYNDYDDRNYYSNDYNSQRNNGYYQNHNDRYNTNTDSFNTYTSTHNQNTVRNVNQRSNENFVPHKPENRHHKSNNQQNRSKTIKRQNETKTTNQIQTRSEILIEQLTKFTLECMVCCQKVRNDKAIWSCSVCYHIFHLHCIKKWAQSPAAKTDTDNLEKWRCPGCQSINAQIPNVYKCFCGKKTNPEIKTSYYSKQLPHSCGKLCGKSLAVLNLEQTFICKHK